MFCRIQKIGGRGSPKKAKAQETSEEFTSSTIAFGLAGIESSEDMNSMEIDYSTRCVEISDQLKDKNLTDEQRKKLLIQLRETHDKLEQIRTLYDRSRKYTNDTITRANEVFSKDLKTPFYIPDKKKRRRLFYDEHYGEADPFYDKLEQIYGEDGLYGYRRERAEAFKSIPDADVEWAAQRFEKIGEKTTRIRTYAALAVFAGLWAFYPACMNLGMNPIVYAGLTRAITYWAFHIPEYQKTQYNRKVYTARIKIANELGLRDPNEAVDDYKDEKKD